MDYKLFCKLFTIFATILMLGSLAVPVSASSTTNECNTGLVIDEMLPPMPPSERIIQLVRNDLDNYLNVPIEDIAVNSVKPIVWRDGSLGLPRLGWSYIMVLTPGYIIYLEHKGVLYRYHTDTRQSFKRAWEWQFWNPMPPIRPPWPPIIIPPWPPMPIIK